MRVIRVGRAMSNDVVLSDLSVSKHHLEIKQDQFGKFYLTDLGSTNGTMVNGVRIYNTVPISQGDIIRAGGAPPLPWRNYFNEQLGAVGYAAPAHSSSSAPVGVGTNLRYLPNATATFVLGLCSVVFSCLGAFFMLFFIVFLSIYVGGFFSFLACILGIIGLSISARSIELYRSQSSGVINGYNSLNAGRIMSIVGLVIGALLMIFIILILFDQSTRLWWGPYYRGRYY